MVDEFSLWGLAYEHFAEFRGEHVPKLYAHGFAGEVSSKTYFQSPGLILEFISGFYLRDIADRVPENAIQALCDEAVTVLHRIDDPGVQNKDERLDKALIRQNNFDATQESSIEPVFIELALFEVREKFSAEEWNVTKCRQDEEGALGLGHNAIYERLLGQEGEDGSISYFLPRS